MVPPESLLFQSSPIASKHSGFPLTEVSASEVLVILRPEAAILKLSLQPGRVYVTSFGPTRNWRQGEKPATELATFTRSAKSIFFQANFNFTIFNVIISEFGACLAQNNMAQ